MTSSGMRARILRAFVLFGTTLVVVYAVLVFAAMQRLEDNIFIQRLDRRADQVAAQIESGGAGPGVHEPAPFDAFHAYVGVDNLPPDLRARIGDWPVGDHEFHDDLLVTNRNEHFVAIRTLDGVDERLFVVYDAVAYASVETWWTPIVWVFAGGALLVLVLGLPLGRRLADQLAAPLAELAEIVETSSPDEIAARLGERGAAGEVGVLREALRRSMTRIAAFVERERRFTRNASHELRTPLTVIRGATDLLTRQLSHDPRALGRLGRIDRSVEHIDRKSVV